MKSKGQALSNRDVATLLKAWGFEEVGYKGGHMILALQGRRVQISPRALRKAARILEISLKELLAGPAPAVSAKGVDLDPTEQKEQAVADTTVEVPTFTCDTCGKGFPTRKALGGHSTSHVKVRCNLCGETVIQSGLGSHQRGCAPKKRKPGRPRHPIAEPLSRSKGTKGHDVGVEVPILDGLDDEFPSPEAFKFEDTPVKPVVSETARVQDGVDDDWQIVDTLRSVFFPDHTFNEEQREKFLTWVNATRTLFDSF